MPQTSMTSTRIAILGAGLSGLLTARALHRQGIHDFVLLEARSAMGGRITSFQSPANSTPATALLHRFDLGPSWYWPDFQPDLHALIEHLGLATFAQFDEGDMVIEQSAQSAPMRVPGYAQSPPSMRLLGGIEALVDALQAEVPPHQIRTGHTVRSLRADGAQVHLTSADTLGQDHHWQAEHVLMALPPRLAVAQLQWQPPLPADLHTAWQRTPTWKAPHAKYVAVYETPFWREQGLSGQARSARGPLAEIHDLSQPGGGAALFGFVGVPAAVRATVSEDVLRQHCRAQLARLFGPAAAHPVADALKDWTRDPLTATAQDQSSAGHHAAAPAAFTSEGSWAGRIVGIGSEWSPQYPGYLAGALDATQRGLHALGIPASAAL